MKSTHVYAAPFFSARHSNQLAIFKSKLILRKIHFERRLQSRESFAARERISNKLHFRLKRVCQQRRVQLNAFRGFVDLVMRVELEIYLGRLPRDADEKTNSRQVKKIFN